ncbi:MAG: hypothetical protein H7339_10475, partial [Arcicella sp.]|nr:hypothetical protein [Arcicella sp.]
SIHPEKLISKIEKLAFDNVSVFWELFSYFELYKKTDRILFVKILNTYPSHIRYILKLKQLIQYYNFEIRTFLLTYNESAELLLSHYEEKTTGNALEYIFPKSLTESDKHTIIAQYLESEEPNLNYVDLIRNSKHLKLTSKILLRAKQIAEIINDKYLNDSNATKIEVGASLDMSQSEPVIFDHKGTETNYIYGGLYFDSLLTDNELFDTFKNLFIYTGRDGLIDLVNKNAEMDNLEKVFMKSKNEYTTGFQFLSKNMLSLTQLGIFKHYLIRKNRSIEEFIENYVTHYFVHELNMKGLIFKMPNPAFTSSDKIRLIAPEMDYLLKQFKCFVMEGNIDHDLLQIDSTPIHFSSIPSLLHKKYLFSNHETIRMLGNQFFDPYSILTYRDGSKRNKNLFETLLTESLLKSSLENYQQDFLNHLIEKGFLFINQMDEIKMVNPVMIYIAGLLYKNGCLSYWHYSQAIQIQIDRLIKDGLLESSSTLFTDDEISYLNYHLNKKEFSNSLDLRNKYMHGSNNRSKQVQDNDYLYFLRTLILILMKLKDDLELNLIHKH